MSLHSCQSLKCQVNMCDTFKLSVSSSQTVSKETQQVLLLLSSPPTTLKEPPHTIYWNGWSTQRNWTDSWREETRRNPKKTRCHLWTGVYPLLSLLFPASSKSKWGLWRRSTLLTRTHFLSKKLFYRDQVYSHAFNLKGKERSYQRDPWVLAEGGKCETLNVPLL